MSDDKSEQQIDRLVQLHRELKARRAELESSIKDEVTGIKERMAKIEAYFLKRSGELGVTSFPTPHGTAYRTTKTFVNVDNWDDWHAWAVENDMVHACAKNVAKQAVVDWMKENDGEVPPGLKYDSKYEFNVRK